MVTLTFYTVFLFPVSLISALILNISLHLSPLDFLRSFSRWELRLLIWGSSPFLICWFNFISFPFSNALAISNKLWYIFFQFNTLFISFQVSFLKENHEVCCLTFKHLEIFLFSFCCWFLVWFHDGKRTSSIWFKF